MEFAGSCVLLAKVFSYFLLQIDVVLVDHLFVSLDLQMMAWLCVPSLLEL
jgi:hypothetical protein